MESFSQWLERQFEAGNRSLAMLSEHWRHHTNRRTIIALIVGGTALGYLYIYAIQPPDAFPTGQLVSVDNGQSVSAIATSLQQNGVIRSPLAFRILVFLLGKERNLRAGDYLFKEPESVFAVARAISIGAYGLEPFHIRVPEGATVRAMADIYDKVLPRFDVQAFIAKATPMEGYLFPDTYYFLPNATADLVIQTMRQNFDAQIASVSSTIASSTHPLADVIKMASIIEREAPDVKDRQMIAGVLWRRLKMGMALQSDVTSLYTLPKGASLTAKDLQIENPYNSYLNKGLPPTAIGSPSLAALTAAATPIDKGYLFYLADSSGTTHYSKTFAQQLANEHRYLGK